jgi:hypothetical protein
LSVVPEDALITDVAPRRLILVVAAVVGLLLASTIALWAHYGTAVFFETIRGGLAGCFG